MAQAIYFIRGDVLAVRWSTGFFPNQTAPIFKAQRVPDPEDFLPQLMAFAGCTHYIDLSEEIDARLDDGDVRGASSILNEFTGMLAELMPGEEL